MENTAAVLAFLGKNPAVEWVLHPSLETPSGLCAGAKAAAERCWLHHQLRHQGRPRRRAQIHRGGAAREPSRQCRRRQNAGDPSGQHHPSADGCGRARRRGRRRGTGAHLGRSRGRGRHHRRFWPGAARLAAGLEQCGSWSTAGRFSPAPAAATFDPALPAMVFLHGAGFDHSVWVLLARAFAHHGFGVLAPDLPGHGRSAGPAAHLDRRARGLDGGADRRGRRAIGAAHRPFHGNADCAGNGRAASREGQRARSDRHHGPDGGIERTA